MGARGPVPYNMATGVGGYVAMEGRLVCESPALSP